MWNSEDFNEKLLQGWEKSETSSGIPYYINHKTERTQWDHPLIVKTMEELVDMDCVRYAAYRTAMKLRFIQKRLCLDLVDLRIVSGIFERDGFGSGRDTVVDCEHLYNLLVELYSSSRLVTSHKAEPTQLAELLLNWLLNLYDTNRTGCIQVASVKVGLAALCSARLVEKYNYFFRQVADSSSHVSRKKMGALLHDLIQIPEILSEGLAFGGLNVAPAVDNCFQTAWGSLGLAEDMFLNWLLKDPQTIVWLSTLHRLCAAETVKHEAKCSICKVYPIIGFRYKCLQCFDYDLCQQCFFTGRTSKNHKLKHPTQEYCVVASQKEDTKAFMKTIRNKLSKKHRNKKKLRYLPIYGTQQPFNPDEFKEEVPEADVHSLLSKQAEQLSDAEQHVPPVPREKKFGTDDVDLDRKVKSDVASLGPTERRELESVIRHMHTEQMALRSELDRVRHGYYDSQSDDDDINSENQYLREQQERLEVKQEILESHNRQLEVQLQRLRLLLKKSDPHSTHREPLTSMTPNVPLSQQQHSRLADIPPEPSPTTPYYRNPPPFDFSHSRSPPRYNPCDSLQVVPGSSQSPTHPLSSPLYPTREAYPPSPPYKGSTYRSPPQQIPLYPGPTYKSTPYEPTPVPKYRTGLSDTLDQLGMDSTWDSIHPLSRTQFTLNSLDGSVNFPEEEDVEELIIKMNKLYPANMTHSVLDQSQDTLDEMYLAGHRIGDVCSGYMTNKHQATEHTSLMRLADELGEGEVDSREEVEGLDEYMKDESSLQDEQD